MEIIAYPPDGMSHMLNTMVDRYVVTSSANNGGNNSAAILKVWLPCQRERVRVRKFKI